MTTPNVPHRFEMELTVPGTPAQVWQAIATAEGLTAWMMPSEFDGRLDGELTFHMGPNPEDTSRGRITAFESERRVAYEEYWDALVGREGAEVTPLVTEFVIEPASGGNCVVRVVTSAFGTGADWENEFFEDMTRGWAPILDNLRIYLEAFPGQRAATMWAGTTMTGLTAEAAMDAVRDSMGGVAVGDAVAVLDTKGHIERSLERHFLLRLDDPVEGLLNFFAFGNDEGCGVSVQGHVFSEGADSYVEREQPRWQAWLDEVAAQR
jgi:uncharacterized protein YndB with AHSA1/START domain